MNIKKLKNIIKKKKNRPLPHGFMQRDLQKIFLPRKFDEEQMENKLLYLKNYELTFNDREKDRRLDINREDTMQRKAIISKVMNKLASRKMDQPPKKWFDMTVKRIMKNSPEYSKEVAKKIVGDIWYNQLESAKRTEIKKEYGKK